MIVNTQEFRRSALHFEKHGKYCLETPGSVGWNDYWTEEKRRRREGYTVGGATITGDFYHYLNYSQIKLTDDEDAQIAKVKLKKSGTKKVAFPAFWDGDQYYYNEVLEARINGEHMIVAKARRKGFSYKNAAITANRYDCVADSISLIIAFDKKYLYPEGTMAMTTNYVDFLSQYTAWGKRKLIDKQEHIKSGYEENVNGVWIEKGYKSQVMALTAKDNSDVARGKDGTLILLEEAGKFPNLKATYMATKPTVESGEYVTGQILIFGTGGGNDSNWEDFEAMFYSPEEYGLRAYNNEWDEGASGNTCGFFVPVFVNKDGFIDAQGNSLIDEARESEERIRDQIKKTAKDPSTIDRRVAEYPFNPNEAFLRLGTNIFPKQEIQMQINKIKANPALSNLGINGFMVQRPHGLVFEPGYEDARPILKFPHKKGEDLVGCWTIYEDYDPKSSYYGMNDPYAQDQSVEGTSLGATYIMKALGCPGIDDIIVASYVGRPSFMDDYNRQMFMGMEYYHTKLGFENMVGDVVGYAMKHKKTNLLEEQFDLSYNTSLNKSPVNRPYGMHMTKERKAIGEIYIKDWLLTPRAKIGEGEGQILLNLHYIYDVLLLEELLKYNREGNFDRVMSFMIGRFYAKEIDYHRMKAEEDEISDDDFFNRSSYFSRN